jgi:hypothetical protein
MILSFNKHAWGKHNLFTKLGGGIVGFIGEKLRRAKELKTFNLIFFHDFFLILWGFNGYKEWIIQLN